MEQPMFKFGEKVYFFDGEIKSFLVEKIEKQNGAYTYSGIPEYELTKFEPPEIKYEIGEKVYIFHPEEVHIEETHIEGVQINNGELKYVYSFDHNAAPQKHVCENIVDAINMLVDHLRAITERK
ncbi:hypothetical protein DRO91_06575 [Candidatus Heimdallarchaeota archaeon]|nr:MAG: hypothetical protein DRO91_06575 [Candidatus Heimdallarchaeota archaeon]